MTEQNGTLSYPVDRIDELLDKIAKLDITTLLGCEFEGNTRWYASGEDVAIEQVEDHTYASVKIPVKEGMRFSVDVDSSIFGLPSWYTTDAKGVVINIGNTIYANGATSINIEEGAEAYLYVNNYIGNGYSPQVLLYHSIGQILDILGEKPDTKDVVTELNKKVNKVDGKGLSTNDYTNEEKAQVAKNTSDIAKNISDIAKNAEDITKKANTTEYYPSMAVGVADNLRGRGEATEEIFSYRPSAGTTDNISEEGVATMKRIKGNTIVWNQVVKFRDSTTLNGLTIINENNILRVSGTVTEAFSYDTCQLTAYFSKGLKRDGRKYLISINAPDGIAYGINGFPIVNTKPYFWSDGAGGVFNGYISIKTPVGTTVDYVFSNPQIIDLTQMFGAGNEPTTVEEFYERIPMGIDPYAYNKGELLSVNVESIVTNGFNQWDGQWELGNISTTNGNGASATNSVRSKNYIPVIGGLPYYFRKVDGQEMGVYAYDNDYDFIGVFTGGEFKPASSTKNITNTIVTLPIDAHFIKFRVFPIISETYNDICINLSHSGVRDGEYEPYEERVHEIPEITQYFPEGMRSVGGVFDEINDHEVVQRVGQRVYAEGDNDNPAVMTDGVNTIYPLDTPVVTPITARAINLNYTVWDWGTERAVSDVPSAPFRADIIYGFNAVDTIRMNKSDIKVLLQRIEALESKVAESEAKVVVEQSVE